ncbi:MAG: glycosyltransferase family 39 protein [Anaerolineae bacterium]
MKRRIVLLLIFIAFTLRLAWLGYQSLWYDEGVTWLLSQMTLTGLVRWTAADIQPPLYYALLWLTTRLFGSSECALRLPSAIFGTLTIPLLYVLARRLFSHSLPALLAAFITTLSPALVYYSQEARMYTLLVFEATLLAYILLKWLRAPAQPESAPSLLPQPIVLIYSLTATAALFTHYFAAFLLLAHGFYVVFVLWQRGFPRRLMWQVIQAFGLTALLFAPWLPILLSRLGDDPSYWPGALKLPEALRQLLITFTLGETVFEHSGFRLALGYVLLILIGLIYGRISESTNQRMASQWRSVANDQPAPLLPSDDSSSLIPHPSSFIPHPSSFILFLWLLLPTSLILALSYQSPKFNPRYLLLAWPAFALLLAASLSQLYPSKHHPLLKTTTRHAPRTTYYLPFLFALSFVLATSAFSLYNWFSDRRFAKDDFQALAQFVRERIAPGETVLLSSGHMFPVWQYYYGSQGWTPLPRLERLDVNRVTGLDIAADIAPALKGQKGAWLVSWQDEVIDPNGVVPFWLDLVGRRPHDAGDFQGVRLEHWRLDPGKLELLEQSPIKHPVGKLAGPADSTLAGYNFANQVELLGLTQLSDRELALFWRPRQPLPDDVLLTFNLVDEDGFAWAPEPAVGRPGAYLYPPSRWPAGQVVMTRQALPWHIGTPPGQYLAEVGLGQAGSLSTDNYNFKGWDILDEQGRPLRRTALLGPVNLRQLVRPANGSLILPDTPLVDFSPVILLRQSSLSQTTAEPGDRLRLTLWWQAGQFNLDDISIAFDLVDSTGHDFRVGSSLTPSRNFNLPRWQPGDVVRGQYWLNLPPEVASGPATLQVRLVNIHAFPYDKLFPFEKLDIRPTERIFTPPASVDIPLQADFSGYTTLLGADCRPSGCQVSPGQAVTLTLYWRAETRFETNYTIFTHVLNSTEEVVVNADHTPPKPTQGWVPGEIVSDSVTLTLPADLPPGNYPIEIGLYNAAQPNFLRLPLTSGEMRVILPKAVKVE